MATAKREAIFRLENFEADSLSNGFFNNSTMPKLKVINEIAVRILKSMMGGNRLVNGIKTNDAETSIAATAINLKPNPRPLATIKVIFFPNLSPSISGISTLSIKNSIKKAMGIEKMKNGRSSVPINIK